MGSSAPPPVSGPLPQLLEWVDDQCRALGTSDAESLATRLWRIRMVLETRLRHGAEPGADQALSDRITAIREAEDDLRSLRAVLETMGGPIAWRDARDHVGPPAASA